VTAADGLLAHHTVRFDVVHGALEVVLSGARSALPCRLVSALDEKVGERRVPLASRA
jgi:hypothetical protein